MQAGGKGNVECRILNYEWKIFNTRSPAEAGSLNIAKSAKKIYKISIL